MIIGVKGLTWAQYVSGGEGSAVVYTGGETLADMMVKVDYTTERDDGSFHADDHKIDGVNTVRKVRVSLELAKLPMAARQKILGWAVNQAGTEYSETGDPAPHVGVGFVYGDRYKGTEVYIPYWVYKVQFALENDNAETRGENINFQTRTIAGDGEAVQLESNGPFIFRAVGTTAGADGFSSYADALAWVKAKAGIS